MTLGFEKRLSPGALEETHLPRNGSADLSGGQRGAKGNGAENRTNTA